MSRLTTNAIEPTIRPRPVVSGRYMKDGEERPAKLHGCVKRTKPRVDGWMDGSAVCLGCTGA